MGRYTLKVNKTLILSDREHGNIQASFEYFMKFNIPKNAKILDIGCNYGSLIYNLYLNGYENIYGIDINKKAVQEGKNDYKLISKNIKQYPGEKVPFKDEEFDVVLMFDVIEHILNIEKFLENEVYRVLKKDGYFVFQTPNKYINIPWEIVSSKSLIKWKEWKDYHCSLQTKNSLNSLLIKSGFSNILLEKNKICTEHNKTKLRKRFGFIGPILLMILEKMPLSFYPNFYGCARK